MNRIRQQILSAVTVVVSSILISVCLQECVSAEQTQKFILDQIQIRQNQLRGELYTLKTRLTGISSNDSSVQTLRKVIYLSQCLGENEVEYFASKDSISRSEFSSLLSKCLRHVIDKNPNGIFTKNDKSPKEEENRRRFVEHIGELRRDLQKIEFEFKKELILADEDLFSNTISWLRAYAILNQKLSYLRTNIDLDINPNLSRKELQSVLSFTRIAQCFPESINLNGSHNVSQNLLTLTVIFPSI